MHSPLRSRPFALTALALVLGLGVATQVTSRRAGAQEAPSVDSRVHEIVSRMDRGGLATLWDRSAELQRLGPDAAAAIAKELDAASGAAKLGLAKALLSMEGADAQRGAAVTAVKGILLGDGSRELRVSAAELLALHGQRDEVKALDRDLDALHDPFVKLAVLKTLKKRGKVGTAIQRMKEFLASDDYSVRAEAAIRLGECEEFDASKSILNELKSEPSERGLRAKLLLEENEQLEQLSRVGGLEKKDEIVKKLNRQIEELNDELAKAKSGKDGSGGAPGAAAGPGSSLMRELETKISGAYVDEKKSSIATLTDEAAKGMVDSLDPFSSYMTEKETNAFNESIKQEYAGVGAVVQMDRKSGFLTIVRPIYGGPAYKAGLRSLDQVLDVEGTSTKDKKVEDLVKILKGKRGTKVHLKVKPFLPAADGSATVDMAIKRDFITLPSVRFDMLPGKVGYLQLEQFGAKAGDEVESALAELEKSGMRGLVFDLRGNPGGLLNQAVEVASKFLKKGDLVVYQEGRAHTEVGKRRDFVASGEDDHPPFPMVVLVDENSASAAEIVSGALQVHKRADLVGQQTFGKGSVQQIYPIAATEGRSALRLTIAYYYLPDGRCVHRPRSVKVWRYREMIRNEIERWKQDGQISDAQAKILLDQYKLPPGGILPDFQVETEHFTASVQKQMADVIDSGKLEAWVQKHWNTAKDALHELARWDNFDAAKYPDFDALYGDLKTELSKEDVRKLVRMEVRRFTQDDLAKVLPSDFQEDVQLQAAVLVACQKIGQELKTVGELQFITKKFPKGIERTPQPETVRKGPPPSADDEDETGAADPSKKDKDKKDDGKKAPEDKKTPDEGKSPDKKAPDDKKSPDKKADDKKSPDKKAPDGKRSEDKPEEAPEKDF